MHSEAHAEAHADALTVELPPSSSAVSPGLLDRGAWRDAALVWLAQHLLLFAVVYVGRTLFLTNAPSARQTSWGAIFHHIGGWDAAAYTFIARQGYVGGGAAGFSPLLPALEHVALVTTGADPTVAGLVISNVALLLALGLLRVLVARELGAAVAHRTLLYLVLFPTAFFFDIGYTESLFLLFSVATLLALRGRHWAVAGALAALAVLTRTVGLALLAPLLVECVGCVGGAAGAGPIRARWKRLVWPARRTLLAMGTGVALPLVAFAGFSWFLATRYGSFFAASTAQERIWGKGLGIPFIGFARAGGALLRQNLAPNYFQAHILLDLGFSLLAVALTVALVVVTRRRRLPPAYVAYALALLLFIVALPAHNWYALSSNMRYMLISFPLFMLLGQWGERREVDRWILAVSTPLLALFALIFLSAGWVA